ncbi:MAG: 30S ribosomal protein S12 [Candidatus ainarchaeum sp.]|jgi:small subunit ribosomal protein S12|nr:30S ribosomal protein S12 [Candidatus ainarchaeum sp.]MDD3085949.1 30S ribosomal protein S12 [Candidatus ainarchaeum sp.]MDD4128766.1 30S ribosomal protein S12 [Candidatus ainarchaeum sp.]MDD4467747.1 30S ribosomal protein S12 [Candidatus ainarchaeum sp.]HPM86018.1 30S ribosomal protein S12 [archaeon]
MGYGEFAGKSLEKKRRKWKKKDSRQIKKARAKSGVFKDLLEGAPQGRGIVLQKRGVEAKQPNSGIRKCVRVQLIKNGKELTALAPYDGAIKFIDEHDEVIVEGLGGAQNGPKGDLWGVKYRVTHVNGIALEMLRTGKKEKSKR